MQAKESLKIFLKGLVMGGADVIPGVSGGTMALITGIYERLINGIKGLTDFVKPLSKGNFKQAAKEIRKIDFALFIPLGAGIAIAFLIGSFIIPWLMDNYPAYIYAFFFGLILASIKIVHKQINHAKKIDWLSGLIGFLFAFWIVGLEALKTTPSHLFIFLCGIIAITAMLLPGISGSFMLLMLGQYKFMLEALKGIKIGYLLSFLIGAIISLIAFSRVLAYLLKKHHSKTMTFLVGLMLGALRLPFENIIKAPMQWGAGQVLLTLIFGFIGVVIVLLIGRYETRKN